MRNEAFAAMSEEDRQRIRKLCEPGSVTEWRPDQIVLHSPFPMFMLLREDEKQDVLHGRCVYREYEGTPILDYS